MRVKRLVVVDFRILEHLELDLHPRLNLLVGDNGAGKSSFLETLKLLARAKLTPQQAREHCRRSAEAWSIGAIWTEHTGEAEGGVTSHRGRVRWQGRLQIELDHSPSTAVALARRFLVAPVDWSVQRLVAEGPMLRRQFMDWALFHVEPSYLSVWNRWRRTLAQRNRALVEQVSESALRAWEEPLAIQAHAVNQCRETYTSQLAAPFKRWVSRLLALNDADLVLDTGSASGNYRDVLRATEARDRARRTTVEGPQRADLRLIGGGGGARALSRGQQKLLFAALVLAGNDVIQQRCQQWPLLLIDDFDAELALPARRRLAEAVQEYPGQVFLTQHSADPDFWPKADSQMFHVEHGKVFAGVE